jgi:hypothetical protein
MAKKRQPEKRQQADHEILTSPAGPGIAGSLCGVPEVRGANSAPTVTDLPRVSGLPGVRADNPDGKTQEVSSVPEKVASRKLKSEPMSLDEQLEFLNALRLIRRRPPKVINHKYEELIHGLYFKWIDEQMLQILRPKAQPASGFTPEEADALRVLAQTILQRQQGSAGQPAPAPMVPRTGAKPNPGTPAPLNPGVDDQKFRQAQASFLQELSKMEREGPNF